MLETERYRKKEIVCRHPSLSDESTFSQEYIKFERDVSNSDLRFTAPKTEEILEEIRGIIQNGKERDESIFLSSFIINYDEVVDLLIDAAKVLHGKIFVITSFKVTDLSPYTRSEDEMEKHLSSIQRMLKSGIRIRENPDNHWKFIIAGSRGMIMSANMTVHSLKLNPEAGYVLKGHQLNKIRCYFIDTWKYHTTREYKGRGLAILGDEKGHDCKITSFGDKLKFIPAQESSNHKTKILDLLKSAKQSIDITTYALTDDEVIDALNSSKAKIRIILPGSSRRKRDTKEALEKLSGEINIRYCLENHSKMIIIDDHKVVLSTGNLDLYLDQNGFDLSLVTKNSNNVEEGIEFFEYLWELSSSSVSLGDEPKISEEGVLELNIIINDPMSLSPEFKSPVKEFIDLIKKVALIKKYQFEEFIYLEFISINGQYLFKFKMKEGYLLIHKVSKFDWWRVTGNHFYQIYEKIVFRLIWENIMDEQ